MTWLEALGVFRRPPEARSVAAIEADVRAEIEHHLACQVREFVAQGRSTEEARAEALKRFGDIERVGRACLRIQTGERLVLQRIHVVMTFLLLLAVVFLGWTNLRSHRLAEEAEKLRTVCAALEKLRAEEEQFLRVSQFAAMRHPVIGVGDTLELIDSYGNLHVTEKVAADGMVLVPDAGRIHVDGLPRQFAEQAITEALTPLYVHVDVKVKVLARVTSQAIQFEPF